MLNILYNKAQHTSNPHCSFKTRETLYLYLKIHIHHTVLAKPALKKKTYPF